MNIIERNLVAKSGQASRGEDAIVVTDDFVAVLDGATDKSGLSVNGKAGGRFAAEAVSESIRCLDPALSAHEAIDALTRDLGAAVTEAIGEEELPADPPSVALVVYSRHRAEVWRVGDCSWMRGSNVYQGGKLIDAITAQARRALLVALLRGGSTVNELRRADPGRDMILPLLREQHRFRNLDDPSDDLAFGAVDGTRVPRRLVDIWPVELGQTIVFASDGYPAVRPTLSEAEEYLKRSLAEDPLRIGKHATTKGVRLGHQSYDDRAYVRFRAR